MIPYIYVGGDDQDELRIRILITLVIKIILILKFKKCDLVELFRKLC